MTNCVCFYVCVFSLMATCSWSLMAGDSAESREFCASQGAQGQLLRGLHPRQNQPTSVSIQKSFSAVSIATLLSPAATPSGRGRQSWDYPLPTPRPTLFFFPPFLSRLSRSSLPSSRLVLLPPWRTPMDTMWTATLRDGINGGARSLLITSSLITATIILHYGGLLCCQLGVFFLFLSLSLSALYSHSLRPRLGQ